MRGAWMVAAGVMMVVTPSLADDDSGASVVRDGDPCTTTLECGSGTLRCIDERCHDVAAVLHGDAPKWTRTLGDAAMFSDGHDYGTLIAAADIAATVIEPLLVLGAVSSFAPNSSIFGVLAFVPAGFAGSTVHFVHRRAIPGIISFFAWTSLAGTTFVVGGLFGLAFQQGFEFNSVAAWTAGLAFGAAGAALLTWLDVWMARAVARADKPAAAVKLTSAVIPTHGGAMVSLGATW